jgi:hypothetical protein
MTGSDGADGPKAFYIRLDARPAREAEVIQMLGISSPASTMSQPLAPGVRCGTRPAHLQSSGLSRASLDATHIARGGDIFRDIARMNHLLARPAHVQKADILFSKLVFA